LLSTLSLHSLRKAAKAKVPSGINFEMPKFALLMKQDYLQGKPAG
jgi:hypothetical protein